NGSLDERRSSASLCSFPRDATGTARRPQLLRSIDACDAREPIRHGGDAGGAVAIDLDQFVAFRRLYGLLALLLSAQHREVGLGGIGSGSEPADDALREHILRRAAMQDEKRHVQRRGERTERLA